MRVIVTGGGTGGHIYPAMAVAKRLEERINDIHVLYVGTRDGMESRLVPENEIEFQGISGKGLSKKIGVETVRTVGLNLRALWETKKILKDFRPDLVLGTGGYVSGPVVLAAAIFGIPTLLHEQNVFPGKTNRFLARMVKKVMLSFPESESFLPRDKTEVVGLPVREDIGKIDRKTAAKEFNIDPQKKTLLVTGGSRGALSINKAMIHILLQLEKYPEIQVIWGTGSATYQTIIDELEASGIRYQRSNWVVREYINNMPQALACSDLCICRAGAVTLAELSTAGVASILIPYPHASDNHQEYNARAFEEKGAAKVILDKELNGSILWDELMKVVFNPFVLEEMSAKTKNVLQPGALDCIVEICLRTAWK
ncbi:MAG: UDP-N-acetylglucosamine--N-acetylmuramyl-(pentapeptide) pyrophosphoryl-undecaprenol N-acetylglucosamine transferase [Gracilibacter sp. BRH_c7a]|nr:MAG: UDP-N-acetylglucosamine--N-acetylmuramyl-(pentapeptide) pyrophosphoryl-undecaprenol N-acetylglucosamine transferase [Gracilibacter sp. BRH_c7a]